MRFNLFIFLFAGALLAACSSNGSAEMDTDTVATTASPDSPAGKAISLVAREIEIPPEQITIVSEEALEFSDSSLDCPKPGMAYMQVITPGHKVILEHAGNTYDVRVAGGRGLICDNPADLGSTR
jgi:hypothetical protein